MTGWSNESPRICWTTLAIRLGLGDHRRMLLVALACLSSSPETPPAVETLADAMPDEAPPAAAPALLCPEAGAEATWEPPFPYGPTEVACVAYKARKKECREAVISMPVPAAPDQKQAQLSSWHLAAQCQCDEGRREAMATCVAEEDCTAFAACLGRMVGDDWAPR